MNADVVRTKSTANNDGEEEKEADDVKTPGGKRAEEMVPHVGGGRAGAERLEPSRERRGKI